MTPFEINMRINELKGAEIKNIGIICEASDYPQKYCERFNIPNYSSSIADAWELFEEMQPNVSIEKPSGLYNEVWQVRGFGFIFNAKTAPMAICLAWIKRKEQHEHK